MKIFANTRVIHDESRHSLIDREHARFPLLPSAERGIYSVRGFSEYAPICM